MKIRKSVKYFIMCVTIILIIFSCVNIENIMTQNNTINSNKEIYNYTNKFNYDYTVNLIENKFIPTKSFKMSDETYITDLIDNIDLNLKYNYKGNKESNITYGYEIIGVLTAVYKNDGNERKIWEKEEILKTQDITEIMGNEIEINENVVLDLKDKNTLVKEFEDQMRMSVSAKYNVMLKIKTQTNIEGKEVKNEYIPFVTVDLAEKITSITGANNLVNTEYISKECKDRTKISVPILLINIIVFIGSLALLYAMLKSKTVNIVKNEYRQELNRILRLCQDKIVQVSQNPTLDKENVIDVVDFGEILKVSEELFKPILYYYEEETEEAEFSVISNSIVYRYLLKK